MSSFSRRRTSGGEQQNGTSSSSGREGRASTASATEEKSGGILGWASGAGDWIGEKWDGATETVGGWVDDAQEWAGDIKDVVVGTDVDWGALTEGRLDVETDLDEIADLLPARLSEQFQLDREGSENQVAVSFDRSAGTITLRSDQIALHGLNLDAVKAGASDLRDLEIVLTDPDGKLGLFDGLTDLDSYDVKVTVGGADVTSLVLSGNDGETSVQDASLSQLSFTGTRGEDGLAAEVGLGSAQVRGLDGNTTADALAIEGVTGSLSANGEQGSLAVERLQADGLVTEKGSGSAAIEGLSATVDNKGGGLPFLDEQQDALRANVSVQAANVRDLDSEAADLGYLDLLGADVAYDQVAGTVDGSLASAQLEGLTGPATVGAAGVEGVDFDLTLGEHLDLDVDRLSATGVALPEKKKGAQQQGDRAGGSMTIGADVGNLDVRDLSLPGDVHLDGVSSTDVGFAKNDGGITASAGYASAHGVSAGEMSLERAEGSGVIFGKQGEHLDLDVADVQAHGFSHGDVSVDSARVQGADVSVDPDKLNASATSAEVEGAAFKGVGVESLAASDLAMQRDRASGDLSATLGSARVGGLDTEKQDAGQIDVSGVDFQLQQGQGSVDIDRVSATDFSSGKFAAGAVQANGTSASFGSDVRDGRGGFEADISDAQLSSWSVDGKVGADRTQASGVQVAAGKGELDLDVAQGSSTNFKAGEVGMGTVGFDDLALASRREQNRALDLSVGNASFTQLGAGAASVDSGSVSGLTLDKEGGKGGPQQIGVDQLSAQGIALEQQGQSVRVGGVEAAGLGIDKRSDGLDVELASLDARDLALQKTGGENSSGPTNGSGDGPGIDMAALVRSGTALIDDVDLTTQVGLNEGELGPLGVEEGTMVDGRVVIEDGELTSETGFDLSKPLDAPLWTTVKGAYVNDKDKLKVDMGGLWDVNASKTLNKKLGIDGKELASVAEYGAAAADRMGQGQDEQQSGTQGQANGPVIDQGSLQVNGQVALNPGALDAGLASATLEERLEVDVAMQGGDVAARVERLNTAAVAVATGDMSVNVADVDLDDARVLLDQNNGDLDATLAQIRVEGLKLSKD